MINILHSAKTFGILLFCVFAFAVFADAQTCTPAPVGLVSWYQAENNSLDSRSRNNGTLQNGATFAGGNVGQAFSLDGIDDNVDLGNWFTYTDFTISMWVKPGATQVQYADILDNNHTGGQNWVLQQDSTNTNVYAFSGSPDFSLTPNVWQHLVLNHDSSNAVRVYINGVLTVSGSFAINYNGTQFLRIGRWGNSLGLPSNRHWNGQIDELSIFNRTLSLSEIQAIYNSGTTGMCKPTAITSPSNQTVWLSGDGNANDISGNENNGSLQNGAAFKVGKVGQSFDLDGVDDYISVADNPSVRPATALTIDGWFKFNSASGTQILVAKTAGTGTSESFLLFYSNGILFGTVGGVGGTGSFVSFPLTPTVGTWYHISFTFDDLTNTQAIYVNGISTSGTQNASMDYDSHPVTIGTEFENEVLSTFFNGQIDEVSLYNRALSASEIQSVFTAGIAGKLKTSTAGNSMFSFWKGEANANDSIGSNNGTLNGGTTFASGVVGQSFLFNGSNEVSIPDSPNLNFAPTSPLSVEFWVYRTSSSSLQHIFGKRNNCDGSPINYQMAYFNNQIYFGSGAGNEVTSGQDLPLNTWTHIAGTFDGTKLRLYMNGVLVGSIAGNLGTSSAPLKIGTSGTCAGFGGNIDEFAIYNRALSSTEILNIYQTPNHSANSVGDAAVTFQNVVNAGVTQQIPLDVSLLPALPNGTPTGLNFDISTSATFSGNVGICFNLPSFNDATQFSRLKVFHLESGSWIDRTSSRNFATRTLCESSASLSPFAIVESLAPTAANASINGRVLTANGRPIKNVTVQISGGNSSEIRYARTNPFGYYRFSELQSGETYILSVAAKRYSFANPTRIITLDEDLTGEDFVSDSK